MSNITRRGFLVGFASSVSLLALAPYEVASSGDTALREACYQAALARSLKQTREKVGAEVFNKAFQGNNVPSLLGEGLGELTTVKYYEETTDE